MKDRFEDRLNECLEALLSGRWTLEECLVRYPEGAARLRPLLLTALRLGETLAAEPGEAFRQAARERFLVVTGQRLREALAAEPRPSFVEAARQRFLLAAQRLLPVGEGRGWRLRLPGLLPPVPTWQRVPVAATALAMALLVSFFAFSTYAVATSGDVLPGDWQYPIKRGTERVRLTFAFSEGAHRAVELDVLEERLWEVEALAAKGRPIGEAELGRLRGETASLVEKIDVSSWEAEDVRRVTEITTRQEQVLTEVEPLVEPEARDELEEAQAVSREGRDRAIQALAVLEPTEGEQPSGVVPEEPTATATGEPEASPTVSPTAEAEEPSDTQVPPTAVPPTEVPPTPVPPPESVPGRVVRSPAPDDDTAGLEWVYVVVDRLSLRVPSVASGWFLSGLQFGRDGTAPAPLLLRAMNFTGTSIVVIHTRSGDAWWYVFDGEMFQEVVLRSTLDGQVREVDAAWLRLAYPNQAEVILHILESIEIAPPPTPTPTPTPTETSVPTATAEPEGGAE